MTALMLADGKREYRGLWWEGIAPQHVEETWPFVEHFIEDMLRRGWGEFQPSDVKALCKNGSYQLWVFGRATAPELVVITEILQTPQIRYGVVWGMAGEKLDQYLSFLDDLIIPWMRKKQCSFVEVPGRPGLERKLRTWVRTAVVLRKML